MEKRVKELLSEDYDDIEEVLVGFQLEGEDHSVKLCDSFSVCNKHFILKVRGYLCTRRS